MSASDPKRTSTSRFCCYAQQRLRSPVFWVARDGTSADGRLAGSVLVRIDPHLNKAISMGRLLKHICFAFLLTMFVNAAWAESCPTPAVKHGRALHGAAKRKFIQHCCEQMAQKKGGSIKEQGQFSIKCQAD